MKKFLVLSCLLLLVGCAGIPAEESVCNTRTDAANSVICRVASELGWTVEQVDTALLDITIAAWAFDKIDKEEVLAACDRVEELVLTGENVLMSQVVDLLVGDAAKSKALAAILSRRIVFLNVPELITPFDEFLILAQLRHQREQFGIWG